MRSTRMRLSSRLLVGVSALLLTVFVLSGSILSSGAGHAAAATNGKVLILGSTVSGGAGSPEALAAIAAGHGVDVASDASWAAMTNAQFAAYDALVLGDATCNTLGAGTTTATANAAIWGPAVTGNVIVVGTDPVFHLGQGGGQVTNSGVKFAAAATGKTGAYIALSCYYHDTAPGTPVPLLNQSLGAGFTVTGVGCYNDAHIVAAHAALVGLTDASLSGWSCSVHEAFDGFPAGYIPLAIARDPVGGPKLPGSRNFADGSSGVPYIVARGEGLVPVGNTPDLTVKKELKPGQPRPSAGGRLYYLVHVKNEGKFATPAPPNNVTLIDTPPAGTSIVSWSLIQGAGSCSVDGAGRLVCDLGAKFAAGAEAIVEVVIRTPKSGSLTNTAEVDPFKRIAEGNEANNVATLVTVIP